MDRDNQITQVLARLAALAQDPLCAARADAIDANRVLFAALRSRGEYYHWLRGAARKLAPQRLLEINELLPEYDGLVHDRLIAIEQCRHLGLMRPLVQRIRTLILAAHHPLVLADLGSGGMEVERQVIESLAAVPHHPAVTFLGFDRSADAGELARRNLAPVAALRVLPSLEECARWLKEPGLDSSRSIRVAFCRAAIDDLPGAFAAGTFAVLFHSFFRHHLDDDVMRQVDARVTPLGQRVLEYDGYRNWKASLYLSLFSWRDPIFLAAALMSHYRYATRRQLIARCTNSRLILFRHGCYLRESSVAGRPSGRES